MKKLLLLLPLMILVGAALYTLWVVYSTNNVLTTKHEFGLGLVLVCIVVSFIRLNWGVYLTGITLFLGVGNLVVFTPTIDTDSFGIRLGNNFDLAITIQTFSFLVLIFYLIISRKIIASIFRKMPKE